MIPEAYLTEWRFVAPWKSVVQVEQAPADAVTNLLDVKAKLNLPMRSYLTFDAANDKLRVDPMAADTLNEKLSNLKEEFRVE